jgi:hypothetical protein
VKVFKVLIFIIYLCRFENGYCFEPNEKVDNRKPLFQMFPGISNKGSRVVYSFENYNQIQHIDLDNGDLFESSYSTTPFFNIGYDKYFDNRLNVNFTVGLNFDLFDVNLNISSQYDFFKWSSGKVGIGAGVGKSLAGNNTSSGFYLLFSQSIFKSNLSEVSLFTALQYRSWDQSFGDSLNNNLVEVNNSTASSLIGVDIVYGKFGFTVSFGKEKIKSTDIEYEESSPSNYSSKGDSYSSIIQLYWKLK